MAASASSSGSGSAGSAGGAESLSSTIAGWAPTFRDEFDAVAFAVHAAFLEAGFKCVSLGEGEPEVAEHLPAPRGWNASNELYTFQYAVPGAKGRYIVLKLLRMAGALTLFAAEKSGGGGSASGSGTKNAAIDLNVSDYATAGASGDLTRAYKDDLQALKRLVNTRVIHTFAPPPAAAAPAAEASEERRPAAEPRRDESDPLRVGPPRRPSNPLMDMRYPPFGPRGGDFSGDLMPGGGGSGGMLMGPRNFPGIGGSPGPAPIGGGRGGLPGMGPRFDPYGPFGGMGEPDNDIFRPPHGPGAPRGGQPPF